MGKSDKDEPASVFCENCGNTIKPEAKFCGKCGHVKNEQIVSTPNDVSWTSKPKSYKKWFRSSGSIPFWFMILVVVGLTVAVVIIDSTDETKSMNNQYGNCLDVVLYDTTWAEEMEYDPEYYCRLDLRDNPVCMEAFETSDKPRYFHDELECRGYLKQETNCEKNSVFLQAMGIKCP